MVMTVPPVEDPKVGLMAATTGRTGRFAAVVAADAVTGRRRQLAAMSGIVQRRSMIYPPPLDPQAPSSRVATGEGSYPAKLSPTEIRTGRASLMIPRPEARFDGIPGLPPQIEETVVFVVASGHSRPVRPIRGERGASALQQNRVLRGTTPKGATSAVHPWLNQAIRRRIELLSGIIACRVVRSSSGSQRENNG
jgi:hypothetical protein